MTQTYVQEMAAAQSSAISNTFTITVAHTATSGNTVLLFFCARMATLTGLTITDSKSNTWTVDAGPLNASSNFFTFIASTRMNGGVLASGDTITVTLGAATTDAGVLWWLEEFAGTMTSSYLDKTAENHSGTVVTSGNTGTTATTTQPNEVAVAMIATNNIGAFGAGPSGWSNFTTSSASFGTGPRWGWPLYQILTATGAQSAAWTWSTGAGYQALIATYKSTSTINAVTLSTSQTQSAKVPRSVASVRTGVQAQVLTAARTVDSIRTLTQPQVLTKLRSFTAARKLTETPGVTLTKGAQLSRSMTQGQVATDIRAHPVFFSATVGLGSGYYGFGPYGSGLYGFGQGIILNRSSSKFLTASQGQSVLFSRLLGRTRAVSQPQAPVLARSIAAFRSVTVTSTVTRAISVARTVKAAAVVTVQALGFVAPHTSSGNLSVTQPTTVTVARAAARTLVIIQAQTVGRLFALARLLTGSATPTATVGRARPNPLFTSTHPVAQITKTPQRTLHLKQLLLRIRLFTIRVGPRTASMAGRIRQSLRGRIGP